MEIIVVVVAIIVVLGFFILPKTGGGSSDTGISSSESGGCEMPEKGSGELSAGTTMTLKLPGGAKMEMVWCPPGSFMMGLPADEEEQRRSTLHPVTLAEGFWMAKYAVTQKQWKSVMGYNPSYFKGSNLPVEHVSWYDCMKFCKKAGLSLPTEEQWEYACRAGSQGPYAGTGDLNEMGWHQDVNDCRSTHPVGKKAPNAWGLYDMHGNVWEWCIDVWDKKKPSGVAFDPRTAGPFDRCAIRGGCIWTLFQESCQSGSRGCEKPDFHENSCGELIQFIGFRPIFRKN